MQEKKFFFWIAKKRCYLKYVRHFEPISQPDPYLKMHFLAPKLGPNGLPSFVRSFVRSFVPSFLQHGGSTHFSPVKSSGRLCTITLRRTTLMLRVAASCSGVRRRCATGLWRGWRPRPPHMPGLVAEFRAFRVCFLTLDWYLQWLL